MTAYPDWLNKHISNSINADRQLRTGFAMSVIEDLQANIRKLREAKTAQEKANFQARINEMSGYDAPDGPSMRPDDPFWQATPKRKNDRQRYLDVSAKRVWTLHEHFDPNKAISDIAHVISKIPVVGDAVNIIGEAAAAPFKLASAIASGERLDHALMGALKDQLKIIKDVAPYAQTIVSMVPGIGTGVAAAIGAGAALAEGKSLDEVAKAAIKGAIPGGPVAAAAFDTAVKAASGENLGKAALESARNLVPAGPAQKAFDIGVAVATGEKLQNAVASGLASLAPAQLTSILAAGQKALATTPGLSGALKLVPAGDAAHGFQLAAGLLSHSGLNEKAISAVRAKLAPAQQQGFDAALQSQATHVPWLQNVIPRDAPHLREVPAPKAAVPEPPKPHELTPKAPAPKAPEPLKPRELPTRGAPAVTAPVGPTATPSAPPAPVRGLYGPYPPMPGVVSGAPVLRPYPGGRR